MTKEELETIVKRHAGELGEFFDSVRIFVTQPSPDDCQTTQSYNCGCGNWYASYGQVKEWCVRQEEITRMNERNSQKDEE